MADIIQLLPDHVANQIAAGEVVQRPASVVKELLENSIDANATSIKLIVKEGGKTLIQVIDDGKGMSVTDARMSFERHATSKIAKAEDLFKLQTKGFRGEALASIAAIAHVELKTKLHHEDLGTHLVIEGSKIEKQEPVVSQNGTSISVKHLFYNIPARRNFLKSNNVEMKHVLEEFQRVALAHSNISFQLYHNDSDLLNLPASNLRQRVVGIMGAKSNEKLVPIDENTEVVEISGFIGKPECAKKTRGEQYFFVNDRFIKSPYLNHAVSSAFEGLLKEGTHPSYFIYLNVDPASIDINIHPTKTEIKFDDEHTLYAILRAAVKHSLGQFNIAPVLDFESQQHSFDTPYDLKNNKIEVPKVEVDVNFNPFKEEVSSHSNTNLSNSLYGNSFESSFNRKNSSDNWESLYVGLEKDSENLDEGNNSFSSIEFESEVEQSSLFTDDTVETLNSTYQLHKKYIISTIKSGMLVIDQQRAHQRVMYEHFLEILSGDSVSSQQLLFPITLEFSALEFGMLQTVKTDLEGLGFMFNTFEDNILEVKGIPSSVQESEVSILIDQILADLSNGLPDSSYSYSDMIAKSLSKVVCIKKGQSLTTNEQEHLVNSLFACKEPNISPTNKPVFISMGIDELDKKFV